MSDLIGRADFFKRLFVLGLSGASVPALYASVDNEKKADEIPEASVPFAFLTKPYLQFPAPDAMTVMWITDKPCFSWVEYGENGIQEKAFMETIGLYQAQNRIHKIRLENLKPDTKYSYRVCSKEIVDFEPYHVTFGQTLESETYSFTTHSVSDKEFSFLIMNDIHDKPETIPFLLNLNKKNPYDLICFNGDIMNHLDGESQIIENLIQPCTDTFASAKPFLYIRGNHETRGIFARHLYDYLDTGETPYYSFSRGSAFFIVLDSGEDKPDDDKEYSGLVSFDNYRRKQALWLERQLLSKAAIQARFRIVLMHIPPYCSDDWHGTRHCRELFGPLFNKYKVDMLIAGHTHCCGVFKPGEGDPAEGERKFPVIIGGGPREGDRTLIQVHVTGKTLDLTVLKDSGEVFANYQIKHRGVSECTI
ncbi:MAG: metallophosphoesterase family protein [Tannerella sp.]|jgi:predicted phosphodiesterase|nr:metallophosphoesterase family protein [Tannerella sp.]